MCFRLELHLQRKTHKPAQITRGDFLFPTHGSRAPKQPTSSRRGALGRTNGAP